MTRLPALLEERKCAPEGSHTTAVTASVCSRKVAAQSPAGAFHNLTVRSAAHESNNVSSGLHATEAMAPECAGMSARRANCGFVASHSTIAPSREAEARAAPECENATHHTSSAWPSSTRDASRGRPSWRKETSSKSDGETSSGVSGGACNVCQRTACCSSVSSRFSGSRSEGGMCSCSSSRSSRRDAPPPPSHPLRALSSSTLRQSR
mmetsp:Transcript_42080/g.132950  ORF Transcript_42080/g.132950 Transcript_42080/m.132950 type:complete len:208 (-) Transcript_42080:622-1245(-)